ncbi:hypothetical protein FG386_000551 [Cryptosporidium ryanae]|uniref:uncharacterized protein n=1 Tax=Cryptosporidium ryanae TaxID=515981 RepID=UPI00351A2AA0|nr:hypothetical protein FG386_000551 [Cryptosporidium ryanae]
MNTKCIKKISMHIFHNQIEFKLVISALELNGCNIELNNNNRHILRILMTSFNPVELTTELGGPWEGYFFWNAIDKGVSSSDFTISISDFMDIFQCYGEDTFTIDNKNNNLFKLISYNDKIKRVKNDNSNQRVNGESNTSKDYFLDVYLKDINSEFSFHLKSLARGEKNYSSTDLNLVKCLSEMLNLIKAESDNLNENLKCLTEYNIVNSKNLTNMEEKTINSLNSTFKGGSVYNTCSPNTNFDGKVFEKSPYNLNSYILNKDSPNTGGTLNLSELQVLTEINGIPGNNSYNSSLKDLQEINITGTGFEIQSDCKREKLKLGNEVVKCDLNNDQFRKQNCVMCNKGSLDKISEQIKTYRIVKDISSKYPITFFDSEKNKKLSSNKNHYSEKESSNLRSKIEIMRKAKNQFFSNFEQKQDFCYDQYHNNDLNVNDKPFKNKYCEFYSKKKIDSAICFNSNLKKNKHILTKNNIISKDQLINELSETSGISERIDILKKIIKNTKKT